MISLDDAEARPNVPIGRRKTSKKRIDARRIGSIAFRQQCEIPPKHYCIGELAQITGYTAQQIRALIRAKRLRVSGFTKRGWALFHESVIEELRFKAVPRPLRKMTVPAVAEIISRRAGAIPAAQSIEVFRRLEAGEIPAKIAVEMGVHHSIIGFLVGEHAKMSGGLYLTKKEVDLINEAAKSLPFDASYPVRKGDDVVEIVIAALEQRLCSRCRRGVRAYCGTCANQRANAVARKIIAKRSATPQQQSSPSPAAVAVEGVPIPAV